MKPDVARVPGAGQYSPTNIIKPQIPAHVIGSAEKVDKYWETKLYKRSPGPIYKYSLDVDSASTKKQKNVVRLKISETRCSHHLKEKNSEGHLIRLKEKALVLLLKNIILNQFSIQLMADIRLDRETKDLQKQEI